MILVAIDLSDDHATLVCGETSAAGDLNIIRVLELPTHRSPIESEPHNPESPSDETSMTNGANGTGHAEAQVEASARPTYTSLDELLGLEVDSTLALLPGNHVFFEHMVLPFREKKALDQVVPLQVQDNVPFEIEEFVIDPLVLGRAEEEGYEVLASAAPQKEIATSLLTLRHLGVEPKILTTRASAISALSHFFPNDLSGTYVLLLATNKYISGAFFVDGSLRTLREWAVDLSHLEGTFFQQTLSDLRCSILRLERAYRSNCEKVFVVGSSSLADALSRELPERRIIELDLSQAVSISDSQPTDLNSISWALGLFASELSQQEDRRLINFRRGQFAFKPALGNLIAALHEESFYIILALLVVITWLATLIYTSYAGLSQVDDSIAQAVQRSLPGTAVPYGNELPTVEKKLAEIEEQLKSLGSLSPLSPLESLRELSQLIGQDIDIKIEAINIGHVGLTFRGSVKDNPTLGRLESALKNSSKFCEPRVEPRGRDVATQRVKFQSEFTFCDTEGD